MSNLLVLLIVTAGPSKVVDEASGCASHFITALTKQRRFCLEL